MHPRGETIPRKGVGDFFKPPSQAHSGAGLFAQELSEADCCCNIAISNNVGGVKHDVRTRLHALVEERHLALVDCLRFPTLARF
jgi:hypothetical protein